MTTLSPLSTNAIDAISKIPGIRAVTTDGDDGHRASLICVAFGKTGNDYRLSSTYFVGKRKILVTGPLMVTCLVKVLNPMEWTWIKYCRKERRKIYNCPRVG